MPFEYVRAEGRAKRMGVQLMAIVAEGRRGRIYVAPTVPQEMVARSAQPTGVPETDLPTQALGFRVQAYGMTRHSDLFTPRQLVALTTATDLVSEAREHVRRDAQLAGDRDADAYADAIATYLAFAVSRVADYGSTLATWMPKDAAVRNTFGRQALPMTWDFTEANPLAKSSANLKSAAENVADCIDVVPARPAAESEQRDAVTAGSVRAMVSTDPPYYDNIGYADLSDYFYVWLRRSLADVYPHLFRTVLTPKADELVATPYRFGGDKKKADQHFESGLRKAFQRMRDVADQSVPVTIYYAFKQSESDGDADGPAPDCLDGLGDDARGSACLWLRDPWDVADADGRCEQARCSRHQCPCVIDCSRLPSSIGRRRHHDSSRPCRGLKAEMPEALRTLQHGNIAPVDLAQASIRPWDGSIQPLRQGTRAGWLGDARPHCACADQSGARRNPDRTGGRVRRRHSLGDRLVRAVRPRGLCVRERQTSLEAPRTHRSLDSSRPALSPQARARYACSRGTN